MFQNSFLDPHFFKHLYPIVLSAMKKSLLSLAFCFAAFLLPAQSSNIVISEIMYNNPGVDSMEYLEIYNKGATAVNLDGWHFSRGINFLFPAVSIDPGQFMVVAVDSAAFRNVFGFGAMQWLSGSLSNNGELVELLDHLTNFVDSVRYDDIDPWPTNADGPGSSLVLCDYDSDNADPANWQAANTDNGISIAGNPLFANPGADSDCATGPIVGFLNPTFTRLENSGVLSIGLTLSNGNTNQTQVQVMINTFNSTATQGTDFTLTNNSAIFVAGMEKDTQFIDFSIIDDTEQEAVEMAELAITSVDNGGTLDPLANSVIVNIIDNDTPLSRHLIISGVYDAQPAASGAKGVEFYALDNIADLSIYGFGSANNGNGSDGQEFSFPTMTVDSGSCLYVAADSMLFAEFFGFNADFVSGASNINGDDAIELFENGIVIDVFGDIDMDGSGTSWEYTDGFVYRRDGSGPDGSAFVESNWIYSGIDALQNVPNNAAATTPFPVCSYSFLPNTEIDAVNDVVTTAINTAVTIDFLANDDQPNGLQSLDLLSTGTLGTAMLDGANQMIEYTPNTDICGTDMFLYEICDAFSCDTAQVTVHIECPTVYPLTDIGVLIADSDGNGIADSIDQTAEIRGVVYGIDLRGGDGVQFTLIDNTGGIAVFDFDINYYNVQEGDGLAVQGKVNQFNGLTQFRPDTIITINTGNMLVAPTIVTAFDESIESQLIKLEAVRLIDAAEWTNSGSGFNVRLTNGTDTFTMRIDNDVDIFGMAPITGLMDVTGIGSQFDSSQPYDDGYQIMPRYLPDLDIIESLPEPVLPSFINFFPNPAENLLHIKSSKALDEIAISNMLGQVITTTIEQPPGSLYIDLSGFQSGLYIISFRQGQQVWTSKLVKQ